MIFCVKSPILAGNQRIKQISRRDENQSVLDFRQGYKGLFSNMEISRHWIKSLAYQEEQMEKNGEVAFQASKSSLSEGQLKEYTVEFLKSLRTAFTQNVSYFNQLKGYLSSIRIYAIANTEADFMLFRAGYKLVFSMKDPGLIAIKFAGVDSFVNQQPYTPVEYLKAIQAPFGEIKWTYNNHDIRMEYLIRFYLTQFVKQSISS